MKNETDTLKKTIIELQEKRHHELELIKENLDATIEGLKPINLIKSTIQKASASSEIRSHVVGNVIGLATGFLLKKILIGRTQNPFKILIGAVIQFGVANVVSGNATSIKSTGENILYRFLKHRKEATREELHYNGNDILI